MPTVRACTSQWRKARPGCWWTCWRNNETKEPVFNQKTGSFVSPYTPRLWFPGKMDQRENKGLTLVILHTHQPVAKVQVNAGGAGCINSVEIDFGIFKRPRVRAILRGRAERVAGEGLAGVVEDFLQPGQHLLVE